jgi:spermidine/putrescine ABC transporter ATP-binding subunit
LDTIVKLERLIKRYGEVVAVNNVNLDIERGEFLTLLGPSGSGKTTTLMMIAGFEMPTAGKIFIENEMVVLKPPYKRNIGMAFQNYALFPHMTVFNNIAFPLKMRGLKKTEIAELVKKALELVKLEDYGNRYPKQLSGGQQQRVALARAIVYNPPVLLMDEPLGALDKKLREHMQLEIKQLHRSLGVTVIYVTHDQSEALAMSDRIALMNNGCIEQIGTPTNLYEKPRNKFVADFIGDTNLIINAEIKGEKDGRLQLFTPSGIWLSASENSNANGRSVNLAIRPERIRFAAETDKLTHVYSGVVEEKVYLGNCIRYRILVDGKESLVLTENNNQKAKNYEVGEGVHIGWDDTDINLV